MREIDQTTQDAAQAARHSLEFRSVPGWLSGAISQAARQRTGFSVERENRLRVALGLDVLPEPIPTEPCRSCGTVHTCDCGGKSGHVRWTPTRRPRAYKRIDAMPEDVLAAALRDRVVVSVTTD